MKLFKIDESIRALLDEIEHTDDPSLQAALELAIDDARGARDEKIKGVVAYVKELKADISVISDTMGQLEGRRTTLENKAKRLEGYIAHAVGEGTRWESPDGIHAIAWRKSERLAVIDEALIPVQYMRERLSYEPMKDEIKRDIKGGATVPGCSIEVKQNMQLK